MAEAEARFGSLKAVQANPLTRGWGVGTNARGARFPAAD
jgi:hypothetical protein